MALGEALGVSMRHLSLSIGRSAGWVNSLGKTKGDAISSEDLSKIIKAFPTANSNYILTGKGSPLLDETDTLADFPDSYTPESTDYKELCMAYRQDLADTRHDLTEARDEIRRLREAYFQLLETNNRLMESYTNLQAACLKTGINPLERDKYETKNS